MAILPIQKSREILEKYRIENETLSRDVKANPKDRIAVEVGDSKQPDFKPQVKIMRWDNEVNFSLRAKEDLSATTEYEGEKIKYITPSYEVHLYDKPDAGEDGGFEFEWILPKKPASNVLEATIRTAGLKFFYQPALTQEEIDEGAERPENVIGSYAVYHTSKGGVNVAGGKEYKSGKAFHIYRPKVTDANGNWTWGELNIDDKRAPITGDPEGVLTVTIDQAWLDNAVYPVVVDPTFGYTSIGGSNHNAGNQMYGTIYTLPESGDVSSTSAYFSTSVGSKTSYNYIYDVSSNYPTDLNIQSQATLSNSTAQWHNYSYATTPSLSPNDFYLSLQVSWTTTPFYYDSNTAVFAYSSNTFDDEAPPDPFTASRTDLDRTYSIYATYTGTGLHVVDHQKGEAGDGNDVTINFTALEGDVVVLMGGNSSSGANGGPVTAGYTEIVKYSSTDGAPDMSIGAWYKVMGATPDTSVVGEGGGAAQAASQYVVYVLRGADTSTVVDTAGQVGTESTVAATPDLPAITTVTDGAMVMVVGFMSGTQDNASAAPPGYGYLMTDDILDTWRASIATAIKVVPTAGAEDPGDFESFSAGITNGITIAIRPAGAGGTPTVATIDTVAIANIATIDTTSKANISKFDGTDLP